MLQLGVVKAETPNAAWSAFIESHEGKLLGQDAWEQWEPLPDGSACSRFHGEGRKHAFKEFVELAGRAFQVLRGLERLAQEDCDVPAGFRIALPTMPLMGDSLHRGWEVILYENGRDYPTDVLSVEQKGLWGGIEIATPSHPSFETLRSDLFRASAEAIQLWCDPNGVLAAGEWKGDPTIVLPSVDAEDVPQKPKWDADRRELRFDGNLIKVFKQPNTYQELVIAAFEEEEWPGKVFDPLPQSDDDASERRHAETIAALNKSHKTPGLIHFRGDGTGQGIVWEIVEND